jgi:hypothetical protein
LCLSRVLMLLPCHAICHVVGHVKVTPAQKQLSSPSSLGGKKLVWECHWPYSYIPSSRYDKQLNFKVRSLHSSMYPDMIALKGANNSYFTCCTWAAAQRCQGPYTRHECRSAAQASQPSSSSLPMLKLTADDQLCCVALEWPAPLNQQLASGHLIDNSGVCHILLGPKELASWHSCPSH